MQQRREPADEGERGAPRGLPYRAMAALGCGLFGLGVAVGSYGALTHLLVARGVAPDHAGFGMTLFLLGQLVVVLPADRLTRTRSVQLVAAGGLLVGALGTGIPAATDSLPGILASRSLLGLGQGAAFVGAMKYVGRRTAPDRVATAQGYLGALFTFGLALAIATAPRLVALAGIGPTSLVAAAFTVVGALGTLTLAPVDGGRRRSFRAYLAPLTDPVGRALGLGNMVTFGFLMVATTWYTAVYAGFPDFPITGTLALFAATTVVGRALGGVLAPRVGDQRVVALGLLGLAASLGLFTLALAVGSPVLLGLATVGTALGFSVPFGPLFGLAFSTLADDAGVTLVAMLAIGNAGALVYPWLVGALLAGTRSYVGGFAAMTVTVVAVWLLWRATSTRLNA